MLKGEEVSAVVFPSILKDSFRFMVFPMDNDESVQLWAESKKTKKQYALLVEDLKTHGPPGLPQPVIFGLLAKALKRQLSQDAIDGYPKVDAEEARTGLKVTLVLSVSDAWYPEYVFELPPKDVSDIEILRSLLKDAQDEIAQLKSDMATNRRSSYFKASSTGKFNGAKVIIWKREDFNPDYKLSDDCTKAIINRPGAYQIYVRVMFSDNRNTQPSLALSMNDAVVGMCTISDPGNWHQMGYITEIVEVTAPNAFFEVKYLGPHGTAEVDPNFNRFTILPLF